MMRSSARAAAAGAGTLLKAGLCCRAIGSTNAKHPGMQRFPRFSGAIAAKRCPPRWDNAEGTGGFRMRGAEGSVSETTTAVVLAKASTTVEGGRQRRALRRQRVSRRADVAHEAVEVGAQAGAFSWGRLG